MPSTYSPNLRLELIGSGEQAGTWGTTTNTNLGTLVEQAISGRALIVMANADYTLTTATGASDEARNMYLDITSSVPLTTTRTVNCPAVPKMYVVRNATTGSQSIIISAGGASVTILNGETATVVCDGTNIRSTFSNAVTTTGTQTLTNKTLTSPTINGGSISGITDLALADGGTGASTAAAARTNLGLVSGTYVPTTSNLSAGITSLTDRYGQYIRVGDHVVVTGQVLLTTSTSGQFAFDVSLPVASTFTASQDCMGVASSGTSGGVSGTVFAVTTTFRVTIINPNFSLFAAPISWSAMYVIQ
jgi:hypothetical protein